MYQWWLLLHIVGVAAFLAIHGVTMVVMFRLPAVGAHRERLQELITFSRSTNSAMYAALGVLTIGGIGTGITGQYFDDWWLWAAIGILLLTIAFMSTVAKDYFAKIVDACALRPTGVPRKSDEELTELLAGPQMKVVSIAGTVGLLAILYLMVAKPGLG
jgi:cytochrome bd-type quinol oxidase subunit 2